MSMLTDFISLDLSESTDKIIAEYIWIGGSGMDLRSKAITLNGPVSDPSKLPKWSYDGSKTGQATKEDSEVILYPQAIFKDPFRRGNNILVLCDAYTPGGEPIPTNKRCAAAKIFSDPDVVAEESRFGIHQEYILLPLGWPVGGHPGPQGHYCCGVGAEKASVKEITDAHYKACLYAGINISAVNGEVMLGEVGPVVGISAGDELWVARYILERITEKAGIVLSFDPKPIQSDRDGAGTLTIFSPNSMRTEGGFEVFKMAVKKIWLWLKKRVACGEGNDRRLIGGKEITDTKTFKWGVANRVAPDVDPYVATSMIADTNILKP